MSLLRSVALLLVSSFLWGWAGNAAAQVASPTEMMMRDKPPALPAPVEQAPEVEELSLPTYYLEDENGQLVPVLKRLTYEEWEELYKAKLELANPDTPPRYSLTSLQLAGELVGDAVELTLDIKLELMATGWIRVPLRLSHAALLKPLECDPSDQCFLQFDAEQGYVLWLRIAPPKPPVAEAGEPEVAPKDEPAETLAEASESIGSEPVKKAIWPRSYRLHMSVPVVTKAGEHELLLDLPRKAVSSEFSLQVSDTLTMIPPPMVKLAQEALGNGKARVTLVGVGGEFRLRWTEPASAPAIPELDVQSLVLTEISGPRSLKSTARLRLRSLNGPLRQFSVMLPANLSLVPLTGNETFRVVSPDDQSPPPANDRQLIVIELKKPATESVEVELVASSTRSAEVQYTQFDVTGFEVQEAKLQSGYHAMAVEGDWYLHWTAENSNLRQVDVFPEQVETELAAWKAKNIIARFHCLSYPTNLRVRVTPQRSLVQVEPTYRVQVSGNQLALEATLNYRVRGRKLELLELELGDWKLPTFAPESLVRSEAVVLENGTHSIPLQQPTGGDISLKLRATQRLDSASGTFAFTLPRVRTSQAEREQFTVAPAAVVIIADDDVDVSPRIDQMVGLVPEATARVENFPEREQPPRVYRQTDESNSVTKFAGHIRIMPQTVSVTSLIDVEPRDTMFQVNVRMQYTVKHKPLEWLVLEVPPELIVADAITAEFQLGGQKIIPMLLPVETGKVPMALVTLPEVRRGSFELSASYQWKRPAEAVNAAQNVVIGLLRPAREREFLATESRLKFVSPDPIRLAEDSPWKPVERTDLRDPMASDQWQYQADTLLASVALQPATSTADAQNHTSIRLAWHQTWLTSTRRRDRAVFRIETTQEHIQLQLPSASVPEQVEVRVNGQPVTIQRMAPAENTLLVALPPKETREYVIELMYEVAVRRASHIWQGGLVSFQFAQLNGGEPQRMYWQLVLPSNEYLWFEPSGVTSETRWSVPTWLAPAEPRLTQEQLEQFSGATPTPPPAAGANVYLFSGFGPIDHLTTGVVQRRAIVLLGAGFVLAFALPLIYLPGLRGWKALLTAGVLLLLLGLAFPYPAQLLGSSVVAGCLLVLLARFLQITLSRRRQGPRILPPRDSIYAQATQPSYTIDAVGSSHGTTATAPAIVTGLPRQQEASS